MRRILSIIITITLLTSICQAQEKQKVSIFLNSCLYGMATGALLGVASLAFVNDPAGSTNNIARGASLGLYAGIGIGIYKLQDETPVVTIIPNFQNNRFEGGNLLVTLSQF
jgi:hypothetical protein